MTNGYWTGYTGTFIPQAGWGWLSFFIVPVTIWSLFWMAWALWRAVKDDSKAWFVILLLVHTLGILDIIYIFLVSKSCCGKKKKK